MAQPFSEQMSQTNFSFSLKSGLCPPTTFENTTNNSPLVDFAAE
jgi:hypothetical protein